MNTAPTTVRLDQTLLEQLRFFAEIHGRTMSDIIEEGVKHVLLQHKHRRIDALYDGLQRLDNLSDSPATNATAQIDEILYGDAGTWKGKSE